MSKPPLNPEKTAAGIALDPRTLERVIPESRRPDGSLRKQIKIRPGFTPQEDVRRFRGTKQAQMDSNALPKGHIIGWVPPSSEQSAAKPLSKSAKKNAKRKEKRAEGASKPVREDWEDDEEEEEDTTAATTSAATLHTTAPAPTVQAPAPVAASTTTQAKAKPAGSRLLRNALAAATTADGLASKMEKLNVKQTD